MEWARGRLTERVGDFPGGLGGKGKSAKRWGPGEAERKERIWEWFGRAEAA